MWNSSNLVVDVNTVDTFKAHLDLLQMHLQVKYDFTVTQRELRIRESASAL